MKLERVDSTPVAVPRLVACGVLAGLTLACAPDEAPEPAAAPPPTSVLFTGATVIDGSGDAVSGMDVVDVLYSGYGKNSGGGLRRGDQTPIVTHGNLHLDRDYPLLDHLIRATQR